MIAHLEVLVEELSAERALGHLLPKIVPEMTFQVHAFRGKSDLLGKLPSRLAGYRPTMNAAVVILVDRDDADCSGLRRELDEAGRRAGFTVASVSAAQSGDLLTRIAIEELEAWFIGDVPALCAAYPGVSPNIGARAKYRDPDAVRGGTWEALERLLKEAGHHRGGLRKAAAADDIAQRMNVEANASESFGRFRDGVRLLAEGPG